MKTSVRARIFLRTACRKHQPDNQKYEIETFFHLSVDFLCDEITKKQKKYCLFVNNQKKIVSLLKKK